MSRKSQESLLSADVGPALAARLRAMARASRMPLSEVIRAVLRRGLGG